MRSNQKLSGVLNTFVAAIMYAPLPKMTPLANVEYTIQELYPDAVLVGMTEIYSADSGWVPTNLNHNGVSLIQGCQQQFNAGRKPWGTKFNLEFKANGITHRADYSLSEFREF